MKLKVLPLDIALFFAYGKCILNFKPYGPGNLPFQIYLCVVLSYCLALCNPASSTRHLRIISVNVTVVSGLVFKTRPCNFCSSNYTINLLDFPSRFSSVSCFKAAVIDNCMATNYQMTVLRRDSVKVVPHRNEPTENILYILIYI